MRERDVRVAVAEMLEDSSVFHLRDEGLTAAFIDRAIDVPLAALDLDSLAMMELCIAVELRYGISIAPSHLSTVGSLNALVEHIQRCAT